MVCGVEVLLMNSSVDICCVGYLLIDFTFLKFGVKLNGDVFVKVCLEVSVMIENVVSEDVLNGIVVVC